MNAAIGFAAGALTVGATFWALDALSVITIFGSYIPLC